MTSSKSLRKGLAEARATDEACLPLYAHKYAPKKFTQPQRFACLVLKEFEKKAHHANRCFIWRRDNQKDTKPENRPKERPSPATDDSSERPDPRSSL